MSATGISINSPRSGTTNPGQNFIGKFPRPMADSKPTYRYRRTIGTTLYRSRSPDRWIYGPSIDRIWLCTKKEIRDFKVEYYWILGHYFPVSNNDFEGTPFDTSCLFTVLLQLWIDPDAAAGSVHWPRANCLPLGVLIPHWEENARPGCYIDLWYFLHWLLCEIRVTPGFTKFSFHRLCFVLRPNFH